MPPTRVTPNEVHATPAGPFQRLKPTPPGRRGAGQLLNVPGGDPRGKRRTGMALVDGHEMSQEVHRRTTALLGVPRGGGKLDPSSLVTQWTKARNAVLKEGPRGSGLRTDVGVTAGLKEVDVKFGAVADDHLGAMNDAMEARAAALPLVPPLGSGSLPAPDRAQQLLLVDARVKDDLDQLAEMAALSMSTNDRGLADSLVARIRANTAAEVASWYKHPAAARATAIRSELEEWFATPRTVAGEANAALTELQRAALTALKNELARADAGERIPILLANGVFKWLSAPDPNVDAADRLAEIMQLATAPSDVMQLSADGSRLLALDAEAPGPVQWSGLDRGARGT